MPNPPSTGLPNPFSYDTSNSLVVLDNVTGLMWKRATELDVYAWTNAIARCEGLSFAGYDDWYLPSHIELVTIFDSTNAPLMTDSEAFPDTQPSSYWTSSPYVSKDSPGYAWVHAFNLNGHFFEPVTVPLYVRCVRRARGGTPPTEPSYVIAGDIVVDGWTGLTWHRSVGNSNWADALASCESLPGGFRLPSINELKTLFDERIPRIGSESEAATDAPMIDLVAFPNTPPGHFWSQTIVDGFPFAWCFNFGSGATDHHPYSESKNFRCVR
jgi:hypothetical protein